MSEIYLVGGTTPRTDLDNYVSANINKENAIKSLEYWEKEQGEYDDFHIDHIEIDDLAEHDAKVIDDFLNEVLKLKIYKQVFVDDLRMVAEQMKEKKNETV